MGASLLLRSAVLLLTISVAGCASVRQQVGQTVDGWFGTDAKTETFYAASGLAVYAEASKSAKVVGRLAAREKVGRTKVDRGFAYVVTDRGLEGWVDNAQLAWRLPPSSGVKSTEGGAAATPAPNSVRDGSTTEPPGDASRPDSSAPPPEPASAPEPSPAPPAPAPPEPTATPGPAPTAAAAPEPAVPISEPSPTRHRGAAAPAIFDPF